MEILLNVNDNGRGSHLLPPPQQPKLETAPPPSNSRSSSNYHPYGAYSRLPPDFPLWAPDAAAAAPPPASSPLPHTPPYLHQFCPQFPFVVSEPTPPPPPLPPISSTVFRNPHPFATQWLPDPNDTSYASDAASSSDSDCIRDLIDLVLLDSSTAPAEHSAVPLLAGSPLMAAELGHHSPAAYMYDSDGYPLKGENRHDLILDRRSIYLSAIHAAPPQILPPPPPDMNTAAAAPPCDMHICSDGNREFGLNPILGSPLTAATNSTMEKDYNEICVLHLLMAAAQAVAAREADLASVILVRLKDFAACTSSTAVQRVAAYFGQGLAGCCGGVGGTVASASAFNSSEFLAGFRLLQENSPYIKFGHFTANQAILEATDGEHFIHILDFDIMEGIQWPPLMQALASRRHRRPPPQLRITAMYRPNAAYASDRSVANAQETGKRLTEFAAVLNLPFSFNLISVAGGEEFSAAADVELRQGEVLVVNCMLHLLHMPHKSAADVGGFLRASHVLRPRLLTVVEEELVSATSAAAAFFADALRHYSAICDSLEGCLPSFLVGEASVELVERVFVAPRIERTVREWSGLAAEAAAPGKWSDLVARAGFKPRAFSEENVAQARLLLGFHKEIEGFTIGEAGGRRLVLCWRSQPLFAASAWEVAAI